MVPIEKGANEYYWALFFESLSIYQKLYSSYLFHISFSKDLSATACSNDPNKQCKSNGHCSGGCTSSASAARTSSVEAVNPVRMVFGSVQWIKAADYADLLALLQQHSGKRIRLLGANTGTGDIFVMQFYL